MLNKIIKTKRSSNVTEINKMMKEYSVFDKMKVI